GFRAISHATDPSSDVWQPPAPLVGIEAVVPQASDPLAASRLVAVRAPLLFRVGTSGFEHVNHHGQVDLSLNPRELSALRHFTTPISTTELVQRISEHEEQLSAEQVNSLLERLVAAQLLRSFEHGDPGLEIIFPSDAKST